MRLPTKVLVRVEALARRADGSRDARREAVREATQTQPKHSDAEVHPPPRRSHQRWRAQHAENPETEQEDELADVHGTRARARYRRRQHWMLSETIGGGGR